VDWRKEQDRTAGGEKIIAYHEAGHALCGWFLEFAHPLVKVSIVPRGVAALGYANICLRKYLGTTEEMKDLYVYDHGRQSGREGGV
jgi:ATP-dependent Zn protease